MVVVIVAFMVMIVSVIMVVPMLVILPVLGVQKLRLDLQNSIKIEGVAAEHSIERHVGALGAMQLRIWVDAADASFDFLQLVLA